MTPERHRRVGELYHAAIAMVPEERTTFLEDLCEGDADLLRGIEVRIARADIRDKALAPLLAQGGKTFVDPVHLRGARCPQRSALPSFELLNGLYRLVNTL